MKPNSRKKTAKTKKTSSHKGLWKKLGFIVFAVGCGLCGYEGLKMFHVQKEVAELRGLVQPFGLSVQPVGRAFFVTGEVNSAEHWAKCRSIIDTMREKGTGIVVGNQIRLSESAKTKITDQIQAEVHNYHVKVRFLEDRVLLEGVVRNDYEADKAVEVAKAVLMLPANAPTRSTAAAGSAGEESFAPVLLDMLRVR